MSRYPGSQNDPGDGSLGGGFVIWVFVALALLAMIVGDVA